MEVLHGGQPADLAITPLEFWIFLKSAIATLTSSASGPALSSVDPISAVMCSEKSLPLT